jgi:predicted nucleotidyltransferase component of viral defense system
MILPDSKDVVHKAWLYRILTLFSDNHIISKSLYFKGGTCAAMRGFLDRFSVDLDFDYMAGNNSMPVLLNEMEKVFNEAGLKVKDQSDVVPQYFLKYETSGKNIRNTIKIDVTLPPPESNKYEPVRLNEIDRIFFCQTIDTMFANKLVAALDRFEKNGSIAGRDIYDIHYFFISGRSYNKDVILERRNISDLKIFFGELINFINMKITDKILTQDLNMLLPYEKFRVIRKTLKMETVLFLSDEIKRIS